MQLPSLKQMLALGKEKLNELLAPARAEVIKAKLNLEMAQLKTNILSKQGEVEEMFASFTDEKKINFAALADKFDDVDILEGRLAQYENLMSQLFPDDATTTTTAPAAA